MTECWVDFETSDAYSDSFKHKYNDRGYVNVKEYKKYIDLQKEKVFDKLLCENGHELIFVNPLQRKAYFRHKNVGDINMTEWHKEWQKHFSDIENTFGNKNQERNRRCDVLLNDNTVIEFQNSPISLEEVDARNYDYSVNNKDVLWVVNGEKIKYKNINNEHYLDFYDCPKWKVNSFINCDKVYYDIDRKIYTCFPGKIKGDLLLENDGIDKQVFINNLKNNIIPIPDKNIKQTKLYIAQQGAGSGKTFRSIQLCHNNKEFCKEYDIFIYLTKMNAAKDVINYEFMSQTNEETDKTRDCKKYWKEINGKLVIFATLDSFIFSIGDKNYCKSPDQFLNMVYSVIEWGVKGLTKNNTITYADKNICLYQTLIILDEAQDTPFEYGKALEKIMNETYTDLYVIGDLVQTLQFENNTHKYFMEKNDYTNTEKITYPSVNECRRTSSPIIADFVNHIINFEKYNLPKMTVVKNDDNHDNDVRICKLKHNFYDDEKDKELNFQDDIETVLKLYQEEVTINKRLPEDFIIVTPFTKNNAFVDHLSNAIENYWINKVKYDENYKKTVLDVDSWWKNFNYKLKRDGNGKRNNFSYFHKSENGTCIDLKDSEHSTRIVSIHSSKGDGRPVLFVIGLDNKSLIKFNKQDSLVYDSMIHVAITRAKEKLYYFMTCDTNDKLNKKIVEWIQKQPEEYKNNTFKNVELNYKFQNFNKLDIYPLVNTTIFEKIKSEYNFDEIKETFDHKITKIIDTKHHTIRFQSMYILILLNALEYSYKNSRNYKDTECESTFAMFSKLSKASITSHDKYGSYMKSLYDVYKNKYKNKDKYENKVVHIFNFENDDSYKKNVNEIISIMENIKNKLKKFFISGKIEINYIESIILYYMIQISEKGIKSNFLAKELLEIYTIIIDDKEKIYEKLHYESIEKVNLQFNQIIDNVFKSDTHYFLYSHMKKYEGETTKFEVYNTYDLIAYNKDDTKNIIIFYIKPQYNSINENEIKIKSIIDVFFIKHTNDKNKRYEPENISVIIISTDTNEPKIFKWKISDEIDSIFKNMLHTQLENKYMNETLLFYEYYKQKIQNTDKIKTKIKLFINEYKRKHMKNNETQYNDIFIDYLDFYDEMFIPKKNVSETEVFSNFLEKLQTSIKQKIESFLYKHDDYEE